MYAHEKAFLDSGQPWSKVEIADLADGIVSKDPVAELADFLRRSEKDVRDKARELGHGELPEGHRLT